MSIAESRRGKKPFEVFLSHSYADVMVARKVRNILHQRLGYKVHMHEDVSSGEAWLSRLRREIEQADILVPLITPDSVNDTWVLQETGAAWGLEKQIIPIVTRRDALNQFPIAITRRVDLLPSELDKPEAAERFARAFEETLESALANA